MINREFLYKEAKRFDIELSSKQLEQFDLYSEYLVEYNEKVNLTAITDPKEIVVKHFVDSLLLSKAYHGFERNVSVADVGTGAGFPGMAIKILYPHIQLTLLDSLQKRIVFLEQLGEKLGLEDVIYTHIRAEDAGHDKKFREQFDLVTARAVADLAVLCEYCLPLVKVGGNFVALKGSAAQEEVTEAKTAISLLGAHLQQIFPFDLLKKEDRNLVFIKKISQTSAKYPRKSKQIKHKSL